MTLRDKLKFWLTLNNYIEMIVRDTSLLSLPNAMEDSLDYLKALGGTEITPKVYFDSITASGGCEQRNLPIEYTQLEYLESTGTQYIDTSIIPNVTTRVVAKIAFPDITTTALGWGSRSSGTYNTSLDQFYGGHTNASLWYYSANKQKSITTITPNVFYDMDVTNSLVTEVAIQSIYLFALNNLGTAITDSSSKISKFMIYNNGTLVRNFIPAKHNSDSVLGMYDTVSGAFFINAGTGEFVAGPVVTTPTPDTPVDIYCNNGALKVNTNLYWTEYHGYELSRVDGITTKENSGVDVSGMVDCRTIKSFKITTISPQGTFRVFKYRADNTFIDASSTANVGDIITLEDNVGFFRVQYNFTSGGVDTENILIYNSVCNLGEIYTDGTVETINVHGKNFFDAQWQQGIYNTSTGTHTPNVNNRICNINMIQVKPSTIYTVSCPGYTLASGMRWLFYDANKNFISANTTSATTITTPANTKYINFYIANNLTVATAPDLQIEQDSTATTYEPYFNGGSATTEMLLSIGDYKDTQEVLSGNITRNIGIKVLDGTEDWLVSVSGQMHYAYATLDGINVNIGETTPGILCSHYIPTLKNNVGVDNTIGVRLNKNGFIITDNLHANSVDNWKQWLVEQYTAGTPVIIIYPLETATTESVSPQKLTYIDNYVLTIEDASISNPIVNAINSTHTIPTPDKSLDITCNNGVLKLSKNLYNPATAVDAYLTDTGGLTPSTQGKTSVFIPVKSSTKYTLKLLRTAAEIYTRVCSYDSNENFISLLVKDTDVTAGYKTNTFTTDVNAKYIKISFKSDSTEVQLEENPTATAYHPYGTIYADDTVEMINVHGKNLFDISTSILGGLSSTDGSETVSTARARTDFVGINTSRITVSIDANDNYGIVNSYYYDENKNYIGNVGPTESSGATRNETFAVPNGSRYVRVTFCVYASPATNINPDAFKQSKIQIEQGSTATPYEPYFDSGTATAEMLLKVGNYQDIQSILDGAITRKVGVKVLDGTENWGKSGSAALYYRFLIGNAPDLWNVKIGDSVLCTHVIGKSGTEKNTCFFSSSDFVFQIDRDLTITQFKQWLADQYNAGTPVIVVYSLATPTTESVTGQLIQVVEGNNIAEITQASLDNLELEAKYNNVP